MAQVTVEAEHPGSARGQVVERQFEEEWASEPRLEEGAEPAELVMAIAKHAAAPGWETQQAGLRRARAWAPAKLPRESGSAEGASTRWEDHTGGQAVLALAAFAVSAAVTSAPAPAMGIASAPKTAADPVVAASMP